MKTYVINLDRNPERLASVRDQLDRFGIAFERFPAVYGKELSVVELKNGFAKVRSFIASKKRLSDAEIGVALSHVGCCRRLLETDEPCAFILEDDVLFSEKFPDALRRVAKFVDSKRPQAVLLSGYGVAGGESLPEEIRPEKSAWCADAYVVTRAAAELIIKTNSPVITVADSFKRWRVRYGLELYRALPTTVRQDDVKFASENTVLPKSNWLVRNAMWLLDWLLWRIGK